MTLRKSTARLLRAAILIALTGWASAPIAAWAQALWVRHLESPQNLPARVKAIVFNGYTLDAHRQVTWGRWTVSFGSEAPVLILGVRGKCEGLTVGWIAVQNLLCEHPELGKRRCEMNLGVMPSAADCDIRQQPWRTVRDIILYVKCPLDVLLE